MIFAPDMIPLIRRRSKTMTRRLVSRDHRFGFEKPCPYKPGRCYRVQVTRKWTVASLVEHRARCEVSEPTRARAVLAYLAEPVQAEWPRGRAQSTGIEITVTAVRRERLDDISAEDARREGFRFPAEFQARWERLHKGYDPDQQVWVISFEVGDQRHKFDRDLFMKALPGRAGTDVDEHQDYTDKAQMALDSEAPVVPLAYQAKLSDEARKGDETRRRSMKAEQPRAKRLAAIEQAAENGDQHAKRHLYVIDQRIEAAEEKRAREAAA